MECNSVLQKHDSFYLYDERSIIERTKNLKEAFPYVDFLYSIKCNSNPEVCGSVFSQGFGADAASLGEVMAAADAGLTRRDIFYSAPGKSVEDIKQALEKANLIADSLNEISMIGKIAAERNTFTNIGVRINPTFSFNGGEGIPSKFGIDEEQLLEFISDDPYVRINGIHVHLRSQELNAEVIADYYRNVMDLAERVEASIGYELDYINLGSGIGIPYRDYDEEPDLHALSEALKAAITGRHSRILIEVGRYAVSKCGYYITRVMDRKVSRGKTFIILNNTLNGFIRPSLARLVESCADGVPASEPLVTGKDCFSFMTDKTGRTETVTLTGNLCTASDTIAEDIEMPHLDPGDLVIINNAGAYAAVLSPMQFSSQQRPAEIFLSADSDNAGFADLLLKGCKK